MKYLLRIMYVGSDFCGWQCQPNVRTVQKVLTDAATKLYGEGCLLTGCSRTDSGVHANDFALTLEVAGECESIPTEKIPLAFAQILPSDVSIISAMRVSDNFHARYDVKYKEYVYKIHVGKVSNPFLKDRVWHYPKPLCKDAVERMNAGASAIVGRHDFASFMAQGSKIEDSVRDVKYCSVTQEGDIITLRIAADGFLYNMVRIIVGTLIKCGQGKLSATDIKNIIESKNRSLAGATAPPEGLYLNLVSYN